MLSLRKKDLIVTFNWDPLLYQACLRNHKKIDLPHVIYLHGNVAIGYCLKCKKKGYKYSFCSGCNQVFQKSKLLFPIKQKNYNNDPAINGEWNDLKRFLKIAYILTIFGYRAPNTDIEAIKLMKDAWGTPEDRKLEQIEIIYKPGDNKEEVIKNWEPFIHTHHYQTCDDFYSSWIANHPRRTCDAMWNQLMQAKFLEENPVPKGINFEKLWLWYEKFKAAESKNK